MYPIKSIERVSCCLRSNTVAFSFPRNFTTERQIRYARKTKMHDITCFQFFNHFWFPLPVPFLLLKSHCGKNTAIIRWPPRRATALQVVRTSFLGPRPRLSPPWNVLYFCLLNDIVDQSNILPNVSAFHKASSDTTPAQPHLLLHLHLYLHLQTFPHAN